MDNIIRFPRRTGGTAGKTSPPTSNSSESSSGMRGGSLLDDELTHWARRAVFQLPADFTLETAIDRDLGRTNVATQAKTTTSHSELTAVLDALLAHCVAKLGDRGGVLRIGATLLHQPQRQELTYHGLSAGEYALVLFSANGPAAQQDTNELDEQLVERVRAFGGQVHGSDQGELGLRLALHLPIAEPAQVIETKTADSGDHSSLRVLLVDDDEQVRFIVGKILLSLGCTVVALADGSAALDALEREREVYQLVLSDLTMPHMSGAELTQRIRQQHTQLPIALMTGFSGSLEDHALEALGVFAVLEKPFGRKALLELLEATREELALAKAPL